MIIDPIPLGGPSITHREIECTADAAAVGWNANSAKYIHSFQKQIAQACGQHYAFAASSRGCALHLALLALGAGPGDEILVPEIADISAAFGVVWTGAKPVFCDVDPVTLCLSPASAALRITERTKGIIAAHIYGQPCDMSSLTDLALAQRLFLLEDVTGALGSSWRERAAGSFGVVAVCGFGSMEPVVCGEGGMVISSNKELLDKVAKFGSLGRSQANPFIYDSIGFEYAMSNVQAALGTAQMERFHELLEKKRQIFTWYAERLADTPGVQLRQELPDCRGSYAMTVLSLADPSMIRHDFLLRLQASKVMCAPVHYPLSSMPMFLQVDNPVAYGPGVRAFVLPSGHNRTEEEIEYVASVIKALLADTTLPAADVMPTGWMLYKSETLEQLAKAKTEGLTLPFVHRDEEYSLQAVTEEDLKQPEVISFLTEFRRENMHVLLRHFPITEEHIISSMAHYVDLARDFILFFVVKGEERIGHFGLDDFDFQKRECVAEALMMRPDSGPGTAAAASDTLYEWARNELGIKRVYNHVVGSNSKVRLLASSQGFQEINKTALYKQELPDGLVFRPMYIQGHDTPDEYFVFSAKDL